MNISTSADIKQKIEERRYGYFTFPTLEFTIKYRNPDLIKLSLNGSLPAFLADQVIGAYKANIEGTTEQFKESLRKQKVEADDKLLQELRDRGYNLLEELSYSHRIMNVPESDLDNNIISWDDIPEMDAMAFVMHLVGEAQKSQTETGGEVSTDDIITFPDGRGGDKRRIARKNV
jgi:hypothetical protein